MEHIEFAILEQIIDSGETFDILYCAEHCEPQIMRGRLKTKISLKKGKYLNKVFIENGIKFRNVLLTNKQVVTIRLQHIILFNGKKVVKIK